ncbi:hypothetical protein HK097_006719 [Rhizophlyctis rosea]|uniref:Uncharacterized protein n=1 Tax=Rhizophlyctis rosea TaxID=64517 RepID=A0AAD5X512_9FUNG|nr:hypothetical protein HK097_006719 [Rhizophlyctis rosea]
MRKTSLLLLSAASLAAAQSQLAISYCGAQNSTDTSTFTSRCTTALNSLTCATPIYQNNFHCTPSESTPNAGLTMCISCAGPLDIPARSNGTSPKVYAPTVPAGMTVQVPTTWKLGEACFVFDRACRIPCTVGSTWDYSTQCDKNNGMFLATCMCGDGRTPDVPNMKVVDFVDPTKVVQAPVASATPEAGGGTGTAKEKSGAGVGVEGIGIGAVVAPHTHIDKLLLKGTEPKTILDEVFTTLNNNLDIRKTRKLLVNRSFASFQLSEDFRLWIKKYGKEHCGTQFTYKECMEEFFDVEP